MADNTMKGIIVCLVILFILVVAAIVMSAIALATKSSSGNTGFKVTKVTSTGPTTITVSNPMYVHIMIPGSTASTATVNFTGDDGAIALVRNSTNSAIVVTLASDKDMYTLSSREGSNSYIIKSNTYVLMIWEKGNIYVAPI